MFFKNKKNIRLSGPRITKTNTTTGVGNSVSETFSAGSHEIECQGIGNLRLNDGLMNVEAIGAGAGSGLFGQCPGGPGGGGGGGGGGYVLVKRLPVNVGKFKVEVGSGTPAGSGCQNTASPGGSTELYTTPSPDTKMFTVTGGSGGQPGRNPNQPETNPGYPGGGGGGGSLTINNPIILIPSTDKSQSFGISTSQNGMSGQPGGGNGAGLNPPQAYNGSGGVGGGTTVSPLFGNPFPGGNGGTGGSSQPGSLGILIIPNS